MRRRSALSLVVAAVSLLAAACSDESPTLEGGQNFPGGRPTTLQATLPAGEFFQLLGRFSGYPASNFSPAFLLIAENYAGNLTSHALLRFTFPEALEYNQGGVSRRDTEYTLTAGRLTARIDSAASVAGGGPVTFRLWEVAQPYDPASATWELAVDSTGERTAWTTPGGTRGAQIAEYVWNPAAAGDTVTFAVDSATANRVRAEGFNGFLVTASAGARVRTDGFILRAGAHPKSAAPDTVIQVSSSGGRQQYVFTPEPPRSATALEVGGIRSARALFRLDLEQRVPGCAAGSVTCADVALEDVTLNEVALLLRPVPVPGGFEPRDTAAVNLRRVVEPELGARAPLGEFILGSRTTYRPGDTLVVVPITSLAATTFARDTVAGEFALLSEPEAGQFGVLWFDPAVRLRITYTLPPAPRAP